MRRIIQHETNPPVIPYLGMYLTDLVFIEEGNPKKVAGTSLINYGKCRLVAGAVKKIQNYQQMGYNFKRLPQIQVNNPTITSGADIP
jgi:son of sevenless-like protein